MFTLLSIQYQKHEAQFRLGSRNPLRKCSGEVCCCAKWKHFCIIPNAIVHHRMQQIHSVVSSRLGQILLFIELQTTAVHSKYRYLVQKVAALSSYCVTATAQQLLLLLWWHESQCTDSLHICNIPSKNLGTLKTSSSYLHQCDQRKIAKCL